MQFNKLLKNLIFIFLLMTIVGCSSNKNTDNDQSSDNVINSSIGANANNSDNISSEERVKLQTQQLQKNNIVYFGLDKYDIHPEFIAMLDAHANFLRSSPSYYKVTIEGHTDERGTPEYNVSLGERRANAIKMYLQGRGVSEDQISIISYGKEKPAILGHNEEVYAKNRRAVLIY